MAHESVALPRLVCCSSSRFQSFTTVLLPLLSDPYISRILLDARFAIQESAAQSAQKDAAGIPDSDTKPATSQQSKTSNKRPISKEDKDASTEYEPLTKRRQVATPNGWRVCLNPVAIPDLDHLEFCNYMGRDDDAREEATKETIEKIVSDPRFDPKKAGKEQARQNTTEYLENNEFHFRYGGVSDNTLSVWNSTLR
jgi:hypothetical protein